MENNFDITKIYMETDKKKIRFQNIISVFLNREKNLNSIRNVKNFEKKIIKKKKVWIEKILKCKKEVGHMKNI